MAETSTQFVPGKIVAGGIPLSAEAQPRIEDHALIGNMQTAALVARNGAINWLCLPDFDSDACFASLLGGPENGQWRIAPASAVRETQRRYRRDTLILETDFATETGTVRLIDFMPVHSIEHPRIVRMVVGLEGTVPMHSELVPRFAFGRAVPRVAMVDHAIKAFAGPDALFLRGGPELARPDLVQDFNVSAGDRISYVMSWATSYSDVVPHALDPQQAELETEDFWRNWVSHIRPPVRYREEVVRSLITLKACTYEKTGGIVAAPTTSLPETPGGVRNWDYRFTWLRDASLTLMALARFGLKEEATGFWNWTLRAIAGDPAQLQIMYGIRGERRLTEAELPWLAGYGGAKPARIGNAAYEQFQLDVLGEVALLIHAGAAEIGIFGAEAEKVLLQIANEVARSWMKPDRGIWEMRGPERHFTASKVAAWSAIDKAIRLIDSQGQATAPESLRRTRELIKKEVLAKGFNEKLNTFTQYYGGTGVDASLLFVPLTEFLPPNDPRVVGTVAAIERELIDDGLVLRFRPEGEVDGLIGREGTFLACSFWLVGTYQRMGRFEDARKLFERVLSLRNDVGLLAEEYDPKERRQLGNFPQAFSHFALVNAAFELNQAMA